MAARPSLHSVVEVNSRLRMATRRPRASTGSRAAIAFASCAGGAGKTTLCATVARGMSARSPHVLVADRCPDGIIPLFFNLERKAAGGMQAVYPDALRAGYPFTLVAVPCDEEPNSPTAAWLQKLRAESSFTLLDLPTLYGRMAGEWLEGDGLIVVPLVPDVQSVASMGRVEELAGVTDSARMLFVLNRFEPARALHREIRAHLENLLGERLAPLAIRESELVPEALSLGMTVLDHAPRSGVANDMEQLVAWLEERLASAQIAPPKMDTIA